MQSVILLHGAIGASDQLEPLQTELEKADLDVVSFNFSGHGTSPFNPKGFSISVFADELQGFISELGLKKPSIFGYSMGGYVALYLASLRPDLLGNIATLGTKFHWSPEISAKEIKMLDAKTITEKVPKFAEALKIRHGAQWEELLKKTAQMMIEMGNDNTLKPEHFSKIQNHVLIGLADGDNMVSKEETENVFRQLKNAKRYSLSNTKHPIETVNVNALVEILIPHYK